MIKRIIAFSLLIAVIILVLALSTADTFFLHKEACIAEVNEYLCKNKTLFLSDEYFSDINLLFEQIKKEYGQWDIFNSSKEIAAKAVINKMMDFNEKGSQRRF